MRTLIERDYRLMNVSQRMVLGKVLERGGVCYLHDLAEKDLNPADQLVGKKILTRARGRLSGLKFYKLIVKPLMISNDLKGGPKCQGMNYPR